MSEHAAAAPTTTMNSTIRKNISHIIARNDFMRRLKKTKPQNKSRIAERKNILGTQQFPFGACVCCIFPPSIQIQWKIKVCEREKCAAGSLKMS